jgi:hypothetical protein
LPQEFFLKICRRKKIKNFAAKVSKILPQKRKTSLSAECRVDREPNESKI